MELDKFIAEEGLKELAKDAAEEVWKKAWNFIGGRASAQGEPATEAARGIVILGPGGTGKTTLARMLAGDVNVVIDPPGYYVPSLFAESVPLLGAPEIEIAVVPGQMDRLNREFKSLTTTLFRAFDALREWEEST